jgi:SAM-dependent methyltransferase
VAAISVLPPSGCGFAATLGNPLGELVQRAEAFERCDPQPLALPGDQNESRTACRRRAARTSLDVDVTQIVVADGAAAEEPEAVALELEPPDVLRAVVFTDHDCVRHERIVAAAAAPGIGALPPATAVNHASSQKGAIANARRKACDRRILGAVMTDAARKRFGETAALVAEHQDSRAEETRERLSSLLAPSGDERALDVGTGAGALAIALGPLVREVVGIDIVPELLAEGRKRAPANVELIEADATALPFERGSFDLVCSARTLHHTPRPELVLAEMNRVLRPGGTMLVVDQIAPGDPLAAIELNAFERARDPSTTRILADVDLRGLFDANSLVLGHAEVVKDERNLDRYLDLAGCEGEARERAVSLAPSDTTAEYGWYVLRKPSL